VTARPFLIFLAPLLLGFSAGRPITGKVARVTDGDTAVIRSDRGDRFTCRLYGIDAPEKYHRRKPGQPYALESSALLRELTLGKSVLVTLTGEKTYGRQVCVIRAGEVEVNLEMIKRGMAWAYRKHLKPPFRKRYISAEEKAKKRGIGLWRGENPLPPWRFKALYW